MEELHKGKYLSFTNLDEMFHRLFFIRRLYRTDFLRCMKMAISQAGLTPDDIDYINAHATSTPVGDVSEVNAISAVFGDRPHLAISSTKSSTGHLLGAAGISLTDCNLKFLGAVEAIFSLLAMHHGVIPPTLNLNKLDPNINPRYNYVPHMGQEKKLRAVMSNSFGFGGTNASLVFSPV